MAENKSYSDYSKSILMGDYEPILKSILRQIFKGIYDEISIKCEVSAPDAKDISDFLQWPEDKDLNGTTRYFHWNFFSHKIVDNAYKRNLKFSLKDINNIVNRNIFKNNIDERRRLTDQFGVKKVFKFSIKQIFEVSKIAEELSINRNLAAHGDGLSNPSQALILMSNVSRLLNMTPDVVSQNTKGFGEFERMIREDFLDSILSVIRPDIEDMNLIPETEEDDYINEALINKIDDMNNQLKGLKEINSNLVKNESVMNDILSLVYSPRFSQAPSLKNPGLEIRSVSEETKEDIVAAKEEHEETQILNKEEIEAALDRELSNIEVDEIQYESHKSTLAEEGFDEDMVEGLYNATRSELKDHLLNYRTKIRKEMTKEFPGFKNWHNILMEALIDAMIDNKIDSVKSLKQNETFAHYYDSNQMYGRLLNHYNVEAKKGAAKELFDIQIERYWPEIEENLKEYFSQN